MSPFKREWGSVRPPAVAGRFYSANATELRRTIEGFLREAKPATAAAPKAVIAPHAGHVFSGPIAASAFAQLRRPRHGIQRIVLLGPAHYAPLEGLATSTAEAWATPLGTVPVDAEGIQQIARLPQVRALDEAHAPEHALEVQLPFLQVVLVDFKIVPLLVGEARDEQVAEVIEALWGGDETRFVISSDLSHYHDYDSARELDAMTARAVESLSPQDISKEQACGRIPIRGLLRAARLHGLHAKTVDLRNSGDTAGPRSKVVGYGAWVFE